MPVGFSGGRAVSVLPRPSHDVGLHVVEVAIRQTALAAVLPLVVAKLPVRGQFRRTRPYFSFFLTFFNILRIR